MSRQPRGRVTIRVATHEDVGELGAIERGAARRLAGLGLVDIDDALEPGLLDAGVAARRLWVADDAGTLVGFALGTVVDGQGFLREIDVTESHGRRGIGTELVQTVIAWSRREGHTSIALTTFRDIAWNEPWYHRLGFRFVPEGQRGPQLRAIVERERLEGLTQRTVMRLVLREPAPGAPL